MRRVLAAERMQVGDNVKVSKDGKEYGPYRITAILVSPSLPDQNARVTRVEVDVNGKRRTVPVGAIHAN